MLHHVIVKCMHKQRIYWVSKTLLIDTWMSSTFTNFRSCSKPFKLWRNAQERTRLTFKVHLNVPLSNKFGELGIFFLFHSFHNKYINRQSCHWPASEKLIRGDFYLETFNTTSVVQEGRSFWPIIKYKQVKDNRK